MDMQSAPVFHRLFPSYGEDMPVTMNLNEYPSAMSNLTRDSTQMRWSRTRFDAQYRSDMEHYQHYYWVYVEDGLFALSFEKGDQIVVYRRDNSEEVVKIGTTAELHPGDLIVMVDIVVSAYNPLKTPSTIMTCGYVNKEDPAPCSGGCWLP
ncbi:MAG: hypothetical protein IT537_25950 [Hyphomicrobiales bacterium]|nr:hypothetical protein [Hyphomicrobiales bacterium]